MAKGKSAKKAKKEKKKSGKKAAAKSTMSRVKDRTVKLANNPLVADLVAATLVAAAAALKDSKKARALAEAGADELGKAGKQMADKGGELWQLAQDVARRSLETIGGIEPPAKPKAKTPARKPPAKKKAPARKTPAGKPKN